MILHDSGRGGWAKAATGTYAIWGQPNSDGNGGFFLPGCGEGTGCIVHYSGAKLTRAAMMNGGEANYIAAISRIPGTTEELAVGNTTAADGRAEYYGDILQYS